ncbi:MAG: RecX family transcriptional regulator [bacterium]|nr:RecX family transcriptional regulator [bacterium]
MKITDLKQQKKKLGRFNVFIDGNFAFGISADLRFEKKLEIGQEISEKEVQDLIPQDQIERLLNKALRFLSFRPRSEKELRDHLRRKGRLKEIKGDAEKDQYEKSIEVVLVKLKQMKQLDDREFTRWWIEQREKFKPRGKNLLRLELLAKGIAKETIDELLIDNTEEQFELAQKAAAKKVKYYKKLSEEEFKTKMGQFLVRRGFDWNTVKKVVDTPFDKR